MLVFYIYFVATSLSCQFTNPLSTNNLKVDMAGKIYFGAEEYPILFVLYLLGIPQTCSTLPVFMFSSHLPWPNSCFMTPLWSYDPSIISLSNTFLGMFSFRSQLLFPIDHRTYNKNIVTLAECTRPNRTHGSQKNTLITARMLQAPVTQRSHTHTRGYR